MPSPKESDLLFVYGVPMPSFSKSFAITTAAFFFCCFAILLFKLGYTRSINSMIHDPLLWLILVAMCGVPFVFMLVLAFPPMSWLARIEISNEGIRYFPRPILRWMGEPATKVQVGTDVQEILICQGTQDRYNGFSAHPCGYRIIIRSKGGHTQELKVATGDRLNVRQARVLSEGITTAIGAPVRFVRRAVSETGAPHEISWTPSPQGHNRDCRWRWSLAPSNLDDLYLRNNLEAMLEIRVFLLADDRRQLRGRIRGGFLADCQCSSWPVIASMYAKRRTAHVGALGVFQVL